MNEHEDPETQDDTPEANEVQNKPVPTIQKGRKAAEYRGATCLNCETPLELSDRYCSYCGQLNTTKQLSLKDFFGEFLSTIFTYDSRLRYTLKDLLFKPGTITRNYVSGQFLKYANPFRFFLSVSIIYFLVTGIMGTLTKDENGNQPNINWFGESGDDSDPTQRTININPLPNDSVQALVRKEVAKNSPDSLSTEIVDKIFQEIDSANIKRKERNRIKDSIGYEYISENDLDTLSWTNRTVKRFILYRNYYKTKKIENANIALDSLAHKKNRMNRWIYNKNNSMDRVEKDPLGFINYLLGKIPFFLFFFAPIFAFAFWVLYSKKKYTYMEHMVFIFHIFSFLFLALLIALIPDTILGDEYVTGILFGLVGPFYFYKALRNFYKESRLITIIKFVLLNWVFWIGTTIAALFFFVITAATY